MLTDGVRESRFAVVTQTSATNPRREVRVSTGLLIGTYERQIDDKGRVPLPPDLRREFGEEHGYLVRGEDRCVDLVRAADFEMQAAIMLEAVRRGERDRSEMRTLSNSASKVTPDKQGRITIDEHLREYAGLTPGGVVRVSGGFDRIEFWARERHQRLDAASAGRLAGGE